MRARYVGYSQRVLELDPIAYWPLGERSGTVAYDLVSGRVAGAQNGTHTSVVLGADGMGDGLTATTYDGAADYTDVYSAAFNTAFNGAEGSLVVWSKVSGAGVWTDAAYRSLVYMRVDANNFVEITKSNSNNTLFIQYVAGGTTDNHIEGSVSYTAFFHAALTWSATDDQAAYYLEGIQLSTDSGLGTWAGNLSNTQTTVGAQSTVPTQSWSGSLAHCAVWDRALSAAEIADLAVVE